LAGCLPFQDCSSLVKKVTGFQNVSPVIEFVDVVVTRPRQRRWQSLTITWVHSCECIPALHCRECCCPPFSRNSSIISSFWTSVLVTGKLSPSAGSFVIMSAARQTPGGSQIRIRFLVLSEFAALQVTKGTDSWLRDTDKSFGPDLPLLFTMHEI